MSLALILAALVSSAGPLSAAFPDDSEDIRILVAQGTGGLTLRGSGLQRSLGTSWAQIDRAELRASCLGDRLALTGAEPVEGPSTLRAIGPLSVAGRALRGQVELACSRGRWTAINILPVEEYLEAVLGGEMPPSFPEEALKAQAVAARSYALHRKIDATQEGLGYHLGATVLSQVYGGIASEDERTRRAVAATRGEVLAYGMLPVEAYFHASCGGRTESGEAALGRDLPYLKSVPCPAARKTPYSHWSVRVTPDELQRLAPQLGGAEPTGLRVASRTASGRARTLEVTTRNGARTLTAVQLRAALGYVRLPSLWFDVREEHGAFVFDGRGAGHGVGLCQWGARVLAEQGQSYRDILTHYYPGAEIRRIY